MIVYQVIKIDCVEHQFSFSYESFKLTTLACKSCPNQFKILVKKTLFVTNYTKFEEKLIKMCKRM